MNKPFTTGILVAIVGFVLDFILGHWCIQSSSSSTAAIGYIFLPFEAFIASIPFFVVGFCAHYAIVKLRQRSRIGYLFAAIAVIPIVLFLGEAVRTSALLLAVNSVRTLPQSQHKAFLDGSYWRTNEYVLGALLENPDLDATSLYQIAMIPSLDLHHRMGGLPPIMGKNTKGLAVMRLVVRHPHVDERTLVELANSPDLYVLGDVAGNRKTPVEILRHFFNMPSRDYLIDWGLAQNPNTPVDILQELAKSSNEYTRRFAVANPSFPKKGIEAIIKE
ncbi:MAG: hypothetical protein ACRCUY_05025 [Thermoguttaceae bacterium]